jgi:hypothetical protein
MSSDSSALSLAETDSNAVVVVPPTSGNSSPSPADVHCPPQLSMEAIASILLELPPLDDSCTSPAVAASAAALRARFTTASSDAQALMLSMREIWNKWNLLPVLPVMLPRRDTKSPCPSHAADATARGPPSSSTSSATTNPPLPVFTHQTEVTQSPVDALKAEPRILKSLLAETGATSASNPPPTLSSSGVVAPNVDYTKFLARSAARRDLVYMEAVFNRHAKPVGLSAKTLVSALHAIDPSSFAAFFSDADAQKLMKRADIDSKGYATFEDLCRTAKIPCDAGTEASPARDEFLRFADVKVLSAPALMDALKEVDAPVLLSGDVCSPEEIFRRADADINGSVDLAEYDPASSSS